MAASEPQLAAAGEKVWSDVCWAIESPSLVDGSDVAGPCSVGDMPTDHGQLAQLARLGSDQHRVGHYFEDVVAFWLREIRGVEVVAVGEQVRDGKRTIGELDCVFRDEHGVLTHWELAVKFFLHHPSAGEASNFPGPNASDNFERKVSRLFDHQLPMSEQARPDVMRRQAFFRGCIFRHHSTGDQFELPPRMAADHEQGWWLRSSEVRESELFSAQARGGTIMSKPHWLAHPAAHAPIESAVESLREHFREPAHPLMVSLLSPGGRPQRVIVVNDHWPNRG